ncbi:MAG: hypothetical protein ABSG96_13615 [Terracidiphilus sp.]
MNARKRIVLSVQTFWAVALAGPIFAVSGCALSPLATRTAAFSTAATATVTQTTSAYRLVNQTYADAQMATLVATYDRTGFDATKIKSFLPAKDLEVRTKVLDGLKQYATLLAEVSGNQPITDLETQAKAAGDALVKLQQDDFKGFKIDSTEKDLAVTVVAAIGGVLIEHERARALPGILDKMNKPIQDICKILEDDIGTVGKAGLASEIHLDYDTQIADQQRFIRDNAASLSADQRRVEIEKLPKLVQAQERSDEALAATSKSLAALAAAHAALTATKNLKDAPAFKLELNELLEDAQTIDGFYNSLSSKK